MVRTAVIPRTRIGGETQDVASPYAKAATMFGIPPRTLNIQGRDARK